MEAPSTTLQANNARTCLAAVRDKLSMLSLSTRNYGSISIYKVPENYRNRNEQAYTPRFVSIGFIHHNDHKLQVMEGYKIMYLDNFLNVFQVSLEELVEYVEVEQALVCSCYEDTCIRSLPQTKVPSEVILMDGVFVVELFLKNYFLELREKGDSIFNNPWVYKGVLQDMILFENQLPLRFLYSLYENFVLHKVGKWLDNCVVRPPSFTELAHKYFQNVGNAGIPPQVCDDFPARHFVEFLSILHMPDYKQNLIHKVVLRKVRDGRGRGVNYSECPTATALKAAGVKFQKGDANFLTFDMQIGVFQIPTLRIIDSTEAFFYNLIAFEQFEYYPKYMTSYIILLGNLMKTPKDVALLIDCEIICNEYGSTKKVAELFGNVYKDLVVNQDEFVFVEECDQLSRYRKNTWYSLNAKVFMLTPNVKAIGVIAIVTIFLTLVSTVCSILQVI